MNFFSDKSLKSILLESIVGQTYFLEEIYKLIKLDISKGKEVGKLSKAICDIIEDSEIGFAAAKNLKGKQAKKTRSNINTQIHKELKKFKGYDKSSFDLKRIKCFYDSILKFINEKADVDIDECLMSADFFMKTFYLSSDSNIKEQIDLGNYNLENILKKTDYFTRFIRNETGLGILRDFSSFEVYEDEDISVVYPKSPLSFRSYIESQGISLNNISWCTRTPITWYRYNKKQYVMILRDKRAKSTDEFNYIISLKVGLDGKIDYVETCDRNNRHMNEASVRKILSDKAIAGIQNNINNIVVDYNVEDKDITSNIEELANINRLEEISELISACTIVLKDTKKYTDILFATHAAVGTERFTTILVECLSELYFSTFGEEDAESDVHPYEDRFTAISKILEDLGEETVKLFKNKLYKLAKKSNHPRYAVTFMDFDYFEVYNLQDQIDENQIEMSDIDSIFKKSCSSGNPIAFENLITSFSKLMDRYDIDDGQGNSPTQFSEVPDYFIDTISDSKGFSEYVKTFKIDVITNYMMKNPGAISQQGPLDRMFKEVIASKEDKVKEIILSDTSQEEIKDIDFAILSASLRRRMPTNLGGTIDIKKIGSLVVEDMQESLSGDDQNISDEVYINLISDKEFMQKVIEMTLPNKRLEFCISLIRLISKCMMYSEFQQMSNEDLIDKFSFLFDKSLSAATDIYEVVDEIGSANSVITMLTNLCYTLGVESSRFGKVFVKALGEYMFEGAEMNYKPVGFVVQNALTDRTSEDMFSSKIEMLLQIASSENHKLSIANALCAAIGKIKSRSSLSDKQKQTLIIAVKNAQKSHGLLESINYILHSHASGNKINITELQLYAMISEMLDLSIFDNSALVGIYEQILNSIKTDISFEEIHCMSSILAMSLQNIESHIDIINKIIFRLSRNPRNIFINNNVKVLEMLDKVLEKANKDNTTFDKKNLISLLSTFFQQETDYCIENIMKNSLLGASSKKSLDVYVSKINPVNYKSISILNHASDETVKEYVDIAIKAVRETIPDSKIYIDQIVNSYKASVQSKEQTFFEDPFDDSDLYEYLKRKISKVLSEN